MKTLIVLVLVAALVSATQTTVILDTADGAGAETWLQNDSGGQDDTKGTSTRIELRNATYPRTRIPLLRFDLNADAAGTAILTGAKL